MALGVKITRTIPLHPHGVFVQWELTDASESGTYVFEVYRGESMEGPWTLLEGPTANEYNYVDRFPVGPTAKENDITALSLANGIFYRIVVTPPSGSVNKAETVRMTEPTLSGKQRLLKKKMLRDLAKQLKHLNGVPVAIFKRMTFGPRCTKCFDKYTKELARSNCTTCMGTGYMPGYHNPVLTLARRSVTAVETSMTPQGKTEINVLQMWMMDAPAVEENDVIVSIPDNRRFIVKKMLPTEILTVTVHQKPIVSELARSSIEYRLIADPTRIPSLF